MEGWRLEGWGGYEGLEVIYILNRFKAGELTLKYCIIHSPCCVALYKSREMFADNGKVQVPSAPNRFAAKRKGMERTCYQVTPSVL